MMDDKRLPLPAPARKMEAKCTSRFFKQEQVLLLGSTAGGIRRNAGDTAYEFFNASDSRLKNDLGEFTGALSIVNNIPIHRYGWKDENKKQNTFGFFADEVQYYLPDSVTEADDEMKTKQLGRSQLLDVLWQSVRELSAKVEALENV